MKLLSDFASTSVASYWELLQTRHPSLLLYTQRWTQSHRCFTTWQNSRVLADKFRPGPRNKHIWMNSCGPGSPIYLLCNPQPRVGAEMSCSSCRWSGGCLPDQTKRRHLLPWAACNYSHNKTHKRAEEKRLPGSLENKQTLPGSLSVPEFGGFFFSLSLSLYSPLFFPSSYTHVNNEP